MSAGRGFAVASTPPLTLMGVGPGATVTLRARDAALVRALLDCLAEIRDRPLGEVRLAFSPSRVEAAVTVTVRKRS